MSGNCAPPKEEWRVKGAPIMPGCNGSAKRLSRIRANIDAPRHKRKPLLRRGKRISCFWQLQMRDLKN
jgi:hypothetical protein